MIGCLFLWAAVIATLIVGYQLAGGIGLLLVVIIWAIITHE